MTQVNWQKITKSNDRDRRRMIWRPYGLPEVLDPEKSALHDGDLSAPWDVPETMFVSVAITGALFTDRINPAQPLTPGHILSEARACLDAGASAIHLHVRDDAGYNTLDVERFSEVVEPLRREYPGIALDGCLVPALEGEWDEMTRALDAKLFDAVPVNATATYIGDALFAFPAPMMMEKARLIIESGAKPIISCYTDADVSNAERFLLKSGIVAPGAFWCVLPALPGCSPMQNAPQMIDGIMRLSSSIKDVDPDAVIFVCAAGRASMYLATVAAMLGLHVRVGMEDTIWRWPHREELVTSNRQALEHAQAMADVVGRKVATPAEYRQIVGLPAAGAPVAG